MKKIVSMMVMLATMISLSACGSYEITVVKNEEEIRTEKSETVQSISEADETEAYDSTDWVIQYEKALQKIIDTGYWVNAVWVNDVDGDGIPLVALSTNGAAFKIPNIILNYKDGKVIVKDDFENNGSGWSVIDKVFFCEGNDYVIFRSYGNTVGTLATNSQTIFTVSDLGAYSVADEEEIILPAEYEAEIRDLYTSEGGNFDISKFQNYIIDELDKSAYETVGADAILIDYADVMKDFGIYDSEEAAADGLEAVVDYLNEQIGTDLSLPSGEDDVSTKEKVIQSYQKILSKCEEGNRYALYDIDGNGVKELIVETGVYKRNLEWHIYTYDTFYDYTTHHAGSFDATHYELYTDEEQNGLYMYKLVKETEELKMINIVDGKAEESVVVSMRPYDRNNPLEPGKRLEMVDYNDYTLLNGM